MTSQQTTSKTLHIALWVVQIILALFFISTGIFKLVKPVAEIAAMWPWAGEYPTLLRFTGVIDTLGGLGLILPALTRIRPELTAWAALGCTALMVSAIAFHFSRGEGANTPFNFGLLTFALFIYWGRRKEPIMPK